MPLLKSVVLGLVVALAAAAGAAAQTWSEYRSAGGRYRIEMPGTPELETKVVKAGQERQFREEATVTASEAFYLVTYADFSAEEVRIVGPQKLLEVMRDSTSEGSKLRSDRALTVAGSAAREYVIDGDGLVIVYRNVLVDTRLYVMTVGTDRPRATADRADIRRFIDSFALIPSVGQDQLKRWCSEGTSYDQIIEGCDAFLKSGSEPKVLIPHALLNRGIANISKEQYDRALQDFDQAIKLKPDLAEAYVGRGDVWNNSGQPKRALLDYEKALSIRLDFAAAHAGRGDAYAALKQYRRAIESYDQAIILAPEQADLFARRGNSYKAMGRAARAAKDYAEGNRLRAR